MWRKLRGALLAGIACSCPLSGGVVFAQVPNVITSTVGEPTPGYNIVTSTFGQNIDTEALEREIRQIATSLRSEEEKQRRIEEAVRNATGGGGAACAEQLDPLKSAFAITADSLGLAGGIAEAVGSIAGVFGAETPGIITQLVGDGFGLGASIIEGTQMAFPNCNAEFTGSILGHANLAVNQGISAFNGGITIGNPDGVSYDGGLAIGGGSISGAGSGGLLAQTGTPSAIAIGNSARAMENNSLALGREASSTGADGTAIGSFARATHSQSTALGVGALASDEGATALGPNAAAAGIRSIAIGDQANAASSNAVALGNASQALAANSVAVGAFASADVQSSAFGVGAAASGGNSVAMGATASASGGTSIAVGRLANASAESAVAIGTNARTPGVNAVAIGNQAQASDVLAVALGSEANAAMAGDTALGGGAEATGGVSTAVGAFASASAFGAAAFGINSEASAQNSVALGNGAIANQANTVSVGSATIQRRIVNLAAGTASTDAVNLGQLQAAIAAIGGGGAPPPSSLISQANSNSLIAVGILTGGTEVNFAGTAGTRVLSGVANGSIAAGSNQAVTGDQLFATNQTVAGNTSAITAIDARVTNIETTVINNSNAIFDLQTQIQSGVVGLVQQSAPGAGLTVGASNDGTSVSFTGTAGDRVLTGVADGAVSAASRDAVNGSQLHATNTAVAANGAAIAALGSRTDALETDVADHSAALTALDDRTTVNETNIAFLNNVVNNNNALVIALQNGSAGPVRTNAPAGAPAAQATGQNSIATGSGASASGSGSVAIGNGASASGNNSVALGPASDDGGEANVVSVGSSQSRRRVTNVAAGTSATDAVNLGQLMSSQTQTLQLANDYADMRFMELGYDLREARYDAQAGTASAMAIAAIPQAIEKGRGMLGFGTATWQGESAMALGISKASDDGKFVLKVGATYNTRGEGGASAGAGVSF